ncbi:DedA family protein [Capillimicrobium parvum]|uniref:Protein DedA n=1 Tax=Capillimicrobium parvum TaxID=2884022 RepID=A0A9E6XWQ5_9ACTN|nr:DedA family protein [Capillimicrobium parvum]UGS35151.1 Protein DedA [Capillimicrobium parvum]
MLDTLVDVAQDALTSPWGYVALFAFAAIDAIIPMVPSESLVITAGVFAASGDPSLPLVVVAAGLGAMVGDHLSFYIGRTAGTRLVRRAKPGSRSRAAFDWAGGALFERGGIILIIARYIPGGRTAATLTMGTVGYPLRSFTLFDAVAAFSWALYSAAIGYIGGHAFEEDPIKGLALGLGLALLLAGVIEVVRHVRARRSRRGAAAVPAEPGEAHGCESP